MPLNRSRVPLATWTRLIPNTPVNPSGLKPCQVSHLIPNFHPNEFLSWYHPVSSREQSRGCRLFSRETLSCRQEEVNAGHGSSGGGSPVVLGEYGTTYEPRFLREE